MYKPPSLPAPPQDPALSPRNASIFMSSSSSSSSRSRNTTLSPPPSIPNASSILPAHHSNNAIAQPDTSSASSAASPSSASSSSSSTTGAPPRIPSFDAAAILPQIRPLLAQSLAYVGWEKDKSDRLSIIRKQIAVDIKAKMVHAEPEGFKYAVAVQVEPNCGQAIKANVACHWDDDSDAVLHEVYSNDSIVCTVVAFAIRVAY